jgi:hypothetical protein
MRRVIAISVLAEFCIAMLALHTEIKDLLWTHPWWHSFLVLIPTIAVPGLAILELTHSNEANRLRGENIRVGEEANRLRDDANVLRAEQTKHVAKITELQQELNKLQAERNASLGRIAANVARAPTEAEINATILRKYIGKYAKVTEGAGSWGSMGAVIAEVNQNNILTLFVPSGFSSSTAFGQRVRCDRLQIVEETVGSCPVQIHIVERYGSPTHYGEAKSWEERNVASGIAQVPRGRNLFSASYRKDGDSIKRGIYVYASTDGSAQYSMSAFEDLQKPESGSWSCGKVEVEKKFAVLQIEWLNAGWKYDGGGDDNSLFLFTKR